MFRLLFFTILFAVATSCGGGGSGHGGNARAKVLDVRISASTDNFSVARSGQVTFTVDTEVINPGAGSGGVTISADCLSDSACVISPRHFDQRGTAEVTVYTTQNTRLGDNKLRLRATEIHPSSFGVLLGGRVAVSREIDVTVSVSDHASTMNFTTSRHRVRSMPRNLSRGDLNGDGIDDIAASTGPWELTLVHRAADRPRVTEFNLADTNYRVPGGTAADVVVADFGGDGLNDFAVIRSDDLRIYRNLGNMLQGSVELPVFTEEQVIDSGPSMVQLQYFDANGDTLKDLIALNRDESEILSFEASTTGQFTVQETGRVGTEGRRFEKVDLDGDADVDLVVLTTEGGMHPLFNDSLGQFNRTDEPIITGTSIFDVRSGDLNGDSVADLASTDRGTNRISTRLGDGSGGFFPAEHITDSQRPEHLLVIDINHDAIPDLAVLNSQSRRVSVYEGYGNAQFAAPVHFSASLNCASGENCGADPHTLIDGDFNGDGWIDLATVVPSTACLSRCSTYHATLIMLLNQRDGSP